MLRRTFTLDDGRLALVVVDADSGTVHLAVREHTWDSWSRPLDEDLDARQDDAASTGPVRVYDASGRSYTLTPDVGGDEVLPTPESSAQIPSEQ